MKKKFFKDKFFLIIYGFIFCIIILYPLTYIYLKFSEKYPIITADFFLVLVAYVLVLSYMIIKEIRNLKKLYIMLAITLMIIIELIVIFSFYLLHFYSIIKSPKYGGSSFYAILFFIITFLSYFIYKQFFLLIKRKIIKKYKAKGIVELNKFQEKAKQKTYEMLKNIGAKYEEFKKIEKENEVYLETGIEINGKYFAIEVSEEAITLAAEKEEDAFILELIDFENANKLIDEFCKRAKEIFEKAR